MAEKRIFVVDDSDFILTATSEALRAAGYEVEALSRWEELDEALKAGTPDLILMDVNMPEMFGDFALMFFKEQRNISNVPILLFSDIEEKELEQRANECEADGFIAKGWGIERMLEVVKERLDSFKKS